MTTIDVLIPVFNRPEETLRAIQSVLDQSVLPTRLILVEDGSTDSAIKPMLEKLATEHPVISVLYHEKNLGIVAAQNSGVTHSKSDYIAFLDCDDWLDKYALELVIKEIKSPKQAYLFTDRIDVLAENGTTNLQHVIYGRQSHRLGNETHVEILLDHMVASHLKVISREAILSVGGFRDDTSGVQDWDLALRISEKFELTYIPLPLYFHSIHSGQDTNSNKVNNILRTNQVRRQAQLRRFNSFPLEIEPRGNKIFIGLVRFSTKFAYELSRSSWIFIRDYDNNWTLLPLTLKSIRVAENAGIKEVFIVSNVPISLYLLKTLWNQKPMRPLIGAYVCGDMKDYFRWNNSYFDYLQYDNIKTEISLLGYLIQEIKTFTAISE